jgi:PAS domain S-box-containing protein
MKLREATQRDSGGRLDPASDIGSLAGLSSATAAAGAFLSLAYLLDLTDWAGGLIYVLAGLLVVSAIFIGIRYHRPLRPMGWRLIAGGILCWTLGDLIWNFYPSIFGQDLPAVSFADGFYLFGYPVLALGLLRLTKARGGDLLDALILSLGFAMPYWLLFVNPFISGNIGGWPLVISTAYPIGDLFLLAMAVRLCLGGGIRNAAARWLFAGIAVVLCADALYYSPLIHGNVQFAPWVEAAYPLAYGLLGAAALHPGLRTISSQGQESVATGSRFRFLVVSALVGPGLLVLGLLKVVEIDTFTLLVLMSVAFVLTIFRIRRLFTVAAHQATLAEIREDALTDAVSALSKEKQSSVAQAQYFEGLISNSSDGIVIETAEGTVSYASLSAERVLGYSVEELTRLAKLALVHPEDRRNVQTVVDTVLAEGGSAGSSVHRVRHRDGSWRWLDFTYTNLLSHPHIRGLVMNFRDVTARIDAELRLDETRAFTGEILTSALECVVTVNAEGMITEFNKAAEETFGMPRSAALGKDMAEILIPDDLREAHRRGFAACLNSPTDEMLPKRRLTTAQRADGTRIQIELSVVRIRIGEVMSFAAFARDVTKQLRADAALKESERRYRSIFDNAVEGIYQATSDGEVVALNPAMALMLGYASPDQFSSEVGNMSEVWKDSVQRQEFNSVLADVGMVQSHEAELRARDGSSVFVSAHARAVYDEEGRVTGVQALLEDITERKRAEKDRLRLEDQLRHGQKMEAVGRLAGGVAHDFNNLLSVVLNYSKFIADDLPEGSTSRADAEEVIKAAARGAELTRQLLTFSRTDVVSRRVIDANESLQGFRKLLTRLLREDIDFSMDMPDRPLMIEFDTGEFEQVVMNLVVNARYAMPQGGRLRLSAEETLLEGVAAQKLDLPSGNYLRLVVGDSGTGMDEATRERVFEPFFTTKPTGEGTGLGLSTVYAIVERSGGTTCVESYPNQGSIFTVYLPLTDKRPDDAPAIGPIARMNQAEVLRILLAEDEPGVRKAATRILEGEGFQVTPAANGADAMKLFTADRDAFDVLVTDVIMPGMSGKELAQRTGLKTVFMSGYTDTLLDEAGLSKGFETFVKKPFTADSLVDALNGLLGTGVGSPHALA